MRVVILGAGTVGHSVAAMLCRERHSVTVVDTDAEQIKHINETLDVRGLAGSASQSSVLFQAGISSVDLCLAVTGDDEVNLVAASMARSMGARRVVARVYAPVFRDLSTFDYQRHFGIDRLLSLEHLSAMELARAIRHPGSVVVENLARGEIEVSEVTAAPKGKLVGKTLREIGLPKGVLIGSITKEGESKIAAAEDVISPGDRLTVIGARQAVEDIKSGICGDRGGKTGVVIVGGGETGLHLARILESQRFAVTLLEIDRTRCEFLATMLEETTVVNSDGTRRATLEEERVASTDVFVACTGEDEDNIMAAVEARDLGAKGAMAIVGRPDYAQVVGKLGIDFAVSPRQAMAKQIMGYLTSGPVVSRTPLGEGDIVALEIEVQKDAAVTKEIIAALHLPKQCLIAAVTRDDYAFVPGAKDQLRTGDTIVALLHDRDASELTPLFERGD